MAIASRDAHSMLDWPYKITIKYGHWPIYRASVDRCTRNAGLRYMYIMKVLWVDLLIKICTKEGSFINCMAGDDIISTNQRLSLDRCVNQRPTIKGRFTAITHKKVTRQERS
jgi:hypothetical protein